MPVPWANPLGRAVGDGGGVGLTLGEARHEPLTGFDDAGDVGAANVAVESR